MTFSICSVLICRLPSPWADFRRQLARPLVVNNGTSLAMDSTTGGLCWRQSLTPDYREYGWERIEVSKGGEIDLTAMTSFTGFGANNTLLDTGGSKILDPNVTTLSDFGDNPGVTLDGSDTQVANSWQSFTNGSLDISGGSYTLPGLTDVDGSDLTVGGNSGAGSLALPGLISFNGVGSFEATGIGSVLDLSHLTGTTGNSWNIVAAKGGEINLSGLTSLMGIGSGNNLSDTGGSQILDPNVTTVSGFGGNPAVTLDGTDTQVANSWQSFTKGSLKITGGSYTLPALTDVDGSNLEVDGSRGADSPGAAGVDQLQWRRHLRGHRHRQRAGFVPPCQHHPDVGQLDHRSLYWWRGQTDRPHKRPGPYH